MCNLIKIKQGLNISKGKGRERFILSDTSVNLQMKIAQIAPLIESVPPRLYGGTERVVSYLTEELVRLGHDVTLFASGNSVTSARLVSCATKALRLDPKVRDPNSVLHANVGPGPQMRPRF